MTAEHFDLYDDEGRPLGTRRPRDRVHRDGDWHRSVALWIVRARGTLVVQRRSLTKDTHPGAFTASVSGHYAAGEQLEHVLREAQEEIGAVARADDLVPVGLWRNDDRPAPWIVDRELVDVFLWPLEQDLEAFAPDPGEIMGLAEIGVTDFQDLLSGAKQAIEGAWLSAQGGGLATISLAARDLVPTVEYHQHVVRAALAYLSGTKPDSAQHVWEGPRVHSLTYGDRSANTP
jgi:isopentenyldiphosphate isomerase